MIFVPVNGDLHGSFIVAKLRGGMDSKVHWRDSMKGGNWNGRCKIFCCVLESAITTCNAKADVHRKLAMKIWKFEERMEKRSCA